MLSAGQIRDFIDTGFVRLDGAFPAGLAAQIRARLWRDLGGTPDDPASWTRPVIRLGAYHETPFLEAANTPMLHAAFDQLVGTGNWLPCKAMGSFPIRFPVPGDPGDTGWHIDASFGTDQPDFLDWRVNIASRGRALLMLFLFSDIDAADAPTRLRAGTHRDIARGLAPAGAAGMTLRALIPHFEATAGRPEVTATGAAGTVYLCHPFIVHAAQPHRGTQPRFLAQPPLVPRAALCLQRANGDYAPVEIAIRDALG